VPAPRTTDETVADLLRRAEVVICVGAGGVGKTSVAATLGVGAARLGRRVLVLTVDPAQRLAEALGVSKDSDERQPLAAERAQAFGIEPGLLSVMMLNPQKSWNELIERTAGDPATKRRVLEHPLYRVVMRYLAGAQEYMAMEKLLTVLDSAKQDLVVLDTPPSRHALDFLKAPQRLIDAVDGPLVKALARRGGGLSLLSRGVALSVRTLGRVMGAPMLEDIAELIFLLDRTLGGFRERAERVAAAFRTSGFAYVLVSRPLVSVVADTLHFEQELQREGLSADAVVVNCSSSPALEGSERDAALEGVRQSGESPALLHKLQRAAEEQARVADAEAKASAPLDQRFAALGKRLVRLPTFAAGVLSERDIVALTDLFGVRTLRG
jgi:anion-transporting  ArsA/GET3 family ATPase